MILGDFFESSQEAFIDAVRSDRTLGPVPVILCTDRRRITEVIRKINGNVNDYLVRPFEKEEIAARIDRVIERHEQVLNSNPLSHLPGNITIKNEVTRLTRARKRFALIYVDLDHFKGYNDYYGYSRGDCVIAFLAELCRERLFRETPGDIEPFAGHIGGDDFILVRSPENVEEFCENFIRDFDRRLPRFYDPADRAKGFIATRDRRGVLRRFPLLSVSMAVVRNTASHPMHFGEMSRRGSEIKKYLKTRSGSHYLVDRRRAERNGRRKTRLSTAKDEKRTQHSLPAEENMGEVF
jgi:GGDEF domain-containing protein